MRFFKGMAGVLAATGVVVAGAPALVGCGKDFNGCQASRTCDEGSPTGESGTTGEGGTSGNDASRGGRGGSAGATAGKSGSGGSSAGTAAGGAGKGGTTQEGEAGAPPDDSGDSGGGGVPSAVGDGGAGTGATDPDVDDEAPYVVSTLPENGAKGVHRDADITVTFSEPMDNVTTEAAYQSADLPRDAVTLLWSKNNTELVIQPNALLGYAAVTDPAADAKHFSFTIAGTATDVAGNPLRDERTSVFTTLRHIEHQLSAVGNGWQIVHEGEDAEDYSMDKAEKACPYPTAKVYAGDRDDDGSLAFVAGFDLSLLPGGIETWKRVTLRAEMTVAGLNPYGRLGNLLAHRITGADTARLAFNVPIVETLGTFNTFATNAEPSLEVTDAIELDYANRTQTPLSTILFRFEESDDSDNHAAQARASCGSIVLDLDYWAP